MKKTKATVYHGPRRWLSLVGMLMVAVGLVALSGWGYTAARRPWLTTHPAGVSVAATVPLEVDPLQMAACGVASAARTLDAAGRPTGYVVVVTRQGYKSLLRLQCTFTADGTTLVGLTVLSQDETEYLGNRIASESFTAGFSGRLLPVKLWTTAAPGSPVDGLTGSTVSAQAVVDGVNAAYELVKQVAAETSDEE